MRDLLLNPAWRPEDLGKPLPDDTHAVSVALPLWEHVVGYEEGEPAIVNALACGYPRFVVHPIVAKLFAAAEADLAGPGERVVLAPSSAAAGRSRDYIAHFGSVSPRIESWRDNLTAVIFPEAGWESAMNCWRFGGEIVSSRRAESALNGTPAEHSSEANLALRRRLADLTGQNIDDIFLFPSGIAAIYAAQRLATELHPKRKTAQIEFPYVDVLKVQEQFGAGVTFLPNCESGGLLGVQKLLDAGTPPAGVFCEIPSNPQLRTANLIGLSAALSPEGIPLIADDTIATIHNVDCFQHADIVTTSLTKFFSGIGDAIGGCLILSRKSPLRETFGKMLRQDHVDDLWPADAAALTANSLDFTERMLKINASTEAVCDFLVTQPTIDQVWYPKTATPELYGSISRPGAGFGGLFSVLFHDPERAAQLFYDQLQVSKGPSLGTNFTLACPYMLLAHYSELDWSDKLGIDRRLVRFSIGLEEPHELIRRLEAALTAV